MTDDQTIEVLKFVNDYRKDMAQLRIKAFYVFHTCQLECFKKINAVTNNRDCMLDCERDLDQVFRYRKQQKPAELAAVYYSSKLYPLDQQHDYEKRCRTLSIKLTDFTYSLNRKLEDLLKGYKKRK